jgi:hypothetical protein
LRDAARAARQVCEAREQREPRSDDVLALPREQRPLYVARILNQELEVHGLNCVVTSPPANGRCGLALRMGQRVLLETTIDQCLAEGRHSKRTGTCPTHLMT